LDAKETPSLWMMIHDECPEMVQKKLSEYVLMGGKLILMGHVPMWDESHRACTILKETLGLTRLTQAHSDTMDAFETRDIPVGFLQCVEGEVGTVFATTTDHRSVGFTKTIGEGKVCFLGAALSTNCLDDLGIYKRISELMGFQPSLDSFDWIDMRLMKGPLGSFLCLNNYQDDPWADTVSHHGKSLFNTRPIELPARSGLILPMNLKLKEDLRITYSTAELRKIETFKNQIVLHFSSVGYVKIESNIYQVDETPEVEINQKDIFLKGNTLNLIRKG
jgi:beta-galactosidase